MKILYIIGAASPAVRKQFGEDSASGLGGYRKVTLITQALVQSGHEIKLLSSAVLGSSRLAWRPSAIERLECCGGSASVVYPPALMLRPVGSFVSCLRAAKTIRDVLEEFEPDLVLVYNTYWFHALAVEELLRTKKVPIILEIEDLPFARRRGLLNLKPWLDERAWGRLLEWSSAFTAVNEPILERLPPEKPKVLLPGVIDRQLLAFAGVRRKPFDIFPRKVGYFGGLSDGKGVGILLDVVGRLPSGWKMVVTGGGPMASRFRQLSKEFPSQLDFHGTVNTKRLYKLMCECDCTVLPPEKIDGEERGVFPFKTLEFLVAGTHVIAPRLPPLKDLDVSFISRWDGSEDSLLQHLDKAESDFSDEEILRRGVISKVVGRYSIDGVADMFSRLISQIRT